VVLATRFSAHLQRDGGWRDTCVTLPDVSWIDAISGVELEGGDVLVAHLLTTHPVALLVPAVSVTDRLQ
jgi:(1->4)-alpha-D-glucan 1-alpha-D-glucosylmutase